MLDILMPTSAANTDLVRESVESFIQNTDVPFRVVCVVDGGTREHVNKVHALFSGMDVDWTLLHNAIPRYLSGCVADAVTICKANFIAIAPPEIVMDDDKWFGKMQKVSMVDPLCGIIDAEPDTRSTSLAPIKRTHHRIPDKSKLALMTKRFAPNAEELIQERFESADPIPELSRRAFKVGLTSWFAPGVRYRVVEHKDHKKCHESSDQGADRSKSPSQTTSP